MVITDPSALNLNRFEPITILENKTKHKFLPSVQKSEKY